MALKLNVKDHNLRRADFRALAMTAGLRSGNADGAIDHMLQRLGSAIDHVVLPKVVGVDAEGRKMVQEALEICRVRMRTLA